MVKQNKYQREIEKLLQASERNVSKELYQMYKDLADDISKEIIALQKEIDETDKFSKKLQRERLEAIRNQMDRKIRIVEQDQKSSIWSFLRYNGDTAYNSLFYEFEMSKKIPLAFGMLTDKQLNVIINTPVASRKLSTRLKGNASKMKKNLNRVLMQGFGKGLSTQKMARQISDIGGAEYRRAMNIARTEAGRVTGVTRQQSQNHAKELGVDVKKKWVSTLDGDTRTNHRELDGQVKEIDERFSVGGHSALQPHMFGIASEDCNCRCTTISVIEGYEPSLRRDNESHEEIGYQNYNDWFKSKSKRRNELQQIFENANGDRKRFAEDILSSYGIDVPVEVKDTDSRGYNQFLNFGEGNQADISAFVLQKGDDRLSNYQFKTALHEAYHSKLQGLEVPVSKSGKFTIREWTNIEETMTETAAHYQMSLLTDDKLMPAYSNYLHINLPRMQKIAGFENCVDFNDFGKKAMQFRFNDKVKTADWRTFYNEINAVEFDFHQYIRDNYIDELKKNKDSILEMIYQNSPSFRQYHEMLKNDYDQFVRTIQQNGNSFSGNTEMIGRQAIVALYRLVGVKPWK